MDASLRAAAPASQLENPPQPRIQLGKQRVRVRQTSGNSVLKGGKLVIAALVAYAFITRTIAAVTVPPWQSPDEPKHFEYVPTLLAKSDQLLRERRLLTLDDGIPELQRQIIDSMARYQFWDYLGVATPNPLPSDFAQAFGISPSQLHRPSLYYDIGAVIMLPFQAQAIESQLLVMRILSAILSALAVLPVYAIARLVAPRDNFVPIAAAALAAMLPMGIFIGGMMSVDNLLLLLGVLAVLGMTRGVVHGFTWREWMLILGSAVLGLLTKRGAVILWPGVLICALIALFRLRWSQLVGALGLTVLVVVLTGLGLRAGVLPVERFMATLAAYSLNSQSQWDNLLKVSIDSEQTWQIIAVELDAYFKSFWGIFGWFNVRLAPEVYTALLIVTVACAIGCVGWLLGRGPDQKRRVTLLLVFATLLVSALVAGVAERLAYYSFGEVPQGRYLFVVLGAIAALYALGLRTWLPASRLGTALPSILLIGSLFALDVYAYFGAILPFYSRSFT